MERQAVVEIYRAKNHFLKLSQLPERWFDQFVSKNPHLCLDEKTFPVYGFIQCLHERILELDKELLDNPEEEKDNFSNKLIKEKYLKEAILTRRLAHVLVPKKEAEQRMKMSFASANSAIVAGIQSSAEELQRKYGGNVREHVEFLTKQMRTAQEKMYESCENITWEDQGSAESLQKRMKKLSEEDPDFEELYDEVYQDEK